MSLILQRRMLKKYLIPAINYISGKQNLQVDPDEETFLFKGGDEGTNHFQNCR